MQFALAGLGSRAAALIIDHLILLAANILIGIAAFLINQATLGDFFSQLSSFSIAAAIVLIFALNWGYFFLLEYFTGGKTPGKKMLGIRAVQENGHSLTLLSSFIRNLLRIVDMLPAAYLLGMVMIFAHPRHKRLGDLAAGTIVIHEKLPDGKETALDKEITRRNLHRDDLAIEPWLLQNFNKKEWELLRTYSRRFPRLDDYERTQLTLQLAELLLPKAGISWQNEPVENLENKLLVLYLTLREEWEYEW